MQNWHLYFLSGASEVFREAGGGDAGVGIAATFAPGILGDVVAVALVESDSSNGMRGAATKLRFVESQWHLSE